VTAGTPRRSPDGASLTLVTSKAFAEDHGLDVLAEVGTNNVAGVDPTVMGIGPVPATRGLLDRAGRTIDDYDLVASSTRRSPPSVSTPAANSESTRSSTTSTAAPSPSATRSAPPARDSPSP